MAHTRSIDKSARIIEQCARGRYIRNVNIQSFTIAGARTNDTVPNRIMADVISSGDCKRGVFVAPSDATVEGISIVGMPHPMHTLTSGLTYIQFYKVRADTTNVPMLSDNAGLGLQIGGVIFAAATSGNVPIWTSTNVVIDGTFYQSGQTSLLAGDAIYTTISSFAIYTSAVACVTTMLEWVPNDKSYASS